MSSDEPEAPTVGQSKAQTIAKKSAFTPPAGLVRENLQARLSDLDVRVGIESAGEWRLEVEAAKSLEVLRRLREDDEYTMHTLVDLTAIDRIGSVEVDEKRFEVVYRLRSLTETPPQRMRVHVLLDAPEVDSVVRLWPAANWLEREVFDLFGIAFRGHPDLRRILLDAGFDGAPLRKDHPLRLERPLPTGEDA